MTETKEICAKCAHTMGNVRRVSGGTDNKVTCTICGKRRYGGTYEVLKKKKGGKT